LDEDLLNFAIAVNEKQQRVALIFRFAPQAIHDLQELSGLR
jgi:hypothetical protein